ncbi:uncharacterized protein LOC117609861 isoform X2 [Osmia lignaria lignaria]|uniref:uncharacterized protein LOC117609861 isoform X2 n=1 Tax=Osmia lignaria lignaria TaxID=1437193 RepID=UPI00402B2688
MYRLTRNQGFLQCIHGLLPVNDNTPSGPLSLWIFIMNCSTIGLELSSLIKAPTVAVKQSMYRVIRCLRTEPQLSLRCFFILFFKNVPKHPCPVRVCVKWKSRCSGPHVIQSLISGINLYVHLPLLDESQEFQWHLPRQNTEGIEGYRATGSPDWGRIHYHGLNNLVVKFSGEQNCLCFIVCQLESFTGIPNRHLLQSGFSQSNQLAAHHTECSTTETRSQSLGEPPRKPESTSNNAGPSDRIERIFNVQHY